MIELTIYWAGVISLLSIAVFIIVTCTGLTLLAVKNILVKNLRSLYNHVQLHYFMKQILDKGYTQAMNDIIEEHRK